MDFKVKKENFKFVIEYFAEKNLVKTFVHYYHNFFLLLLIVIIYIYKTINMIQSNRS